MSVIGRQLQEIRLYHLRKQQEKGIDLIPVNDFSYYDHILDTAAMFGIIPQRFAFEGDAVPLSVYYGVARGTKEAEASEMTKWFNTNYHYIVSELSGATPVITENKPLAAYREAKEKLGIQGKPVIVGPFTFLKLSKGYSAADFDTWLNKLLPLYVQILQELAAEGVEWVQIDEPMLVTKLSDADIERLKTIYETFANSVPHLNIVLQTYFEAVDRYADIISLPVKGIGLDFVHGLNGNLQSLKSFGFPADIVFGVGVIDGRGIWNIHSPRVPGVEEMTSMIERALHVLDPKLFWINPDCGLKTRGLEETVASLRNIMEATHMARAKHAAYV
ncbi:hypothetical protein EJQ19_21480 [Paenibacillus whitsoniae]|uniref:Cobalamin-independent methionine synthase MetE N-terminal domain-containing protein n=1 Tax=Paenibacillus whitsoniae TaxID=2496558 RepID=A0A3S0BJ11_9BACL|nr:hypothetical protein EJQ19_21480 [Paenibacillus whitsoniae]